MPFNVAAVKQHLRDFAFRKLFIEELGWNIPGAGFPVEHDGRTHQFTMVAEKGIAVFECVCPEGAAFPDYPTRLKLERHVAKLHQENILIFTDAARTQQSWLWVKREANGPPRSRQETYRKGDTGERLAQKLQHLLVELEEEEAFTIADARERRKQAFDVEKVTKKFYERFQKEHAAFLKFIAGMPEESRAWYASLMLNRLMFVYFIQKKGFLAGDKDYLKNRLATVQQEKGKDKFGAFYKHFLMRLFHEGLGKKKKERKAEFDKLLGDVPYLNGGLFDVHELEATNADIAIPDEAFSKLFAFFDAYDWHLDDRPLKRDNEINPDVLGFIFEKYINQKQMGAYYTKEDITGYITRNALLPFVLSKVQDECKVAFRPDGVWKLLRERPDRYIYDAVRKGVDLELPADIAAGIGDVSKRGGWNKSAPEAFALPTETWREHVARRQRCLELRAKLRDGQVTTVNDLVTLNLDIVRFVTDVIEECEGADLLKAVYQTLTTVTVLDPTCGSGAFLFAALNILEPLYDACLERMQGFVSEADVVGGPDAAKRFQDFRDVLNEADRHPNRRYFVFRSVVVNNLYGVDIMAEAVEICKLRLFLKLVSQIEDAKHIEPLPDIDFNIRSGNTLVGFASLAEAQKAVDVTTQSEFDQIVKDAAELAQYFDIFREHQTKMREEPGQAAQLVVNVSKQFIRKRLQETCHKLDRYLASAYGVDTDDAKAYKKWRDSHLPFHWFAEFYGIMSDGGFDVIVGNPPYIEYHKIRKDYKAINYATETCGNLYGFVIERCMKLMRPCSRSGMIVQLSSICTDRMLPLQQLYLKNASEIWASCFDDRPGKLFDGLEHIRAAILLHSHSQPTQAKVYTTNLIRWHTETRPHLFGQVAYGDVTSAVTEGSFPKIGDPRLLALVAKIRKNPETLEEAHLEDGKSIVHYYRSPLYWIRGMDFLPHFESDTASRSVHHFKDFPVKAEYWAPVIGSIINSSIFYLWFILYGNGRNVALRDITTFPLAASLKSKAGSTAFKRLFQRLMADYKKHSVIKRRSDKVEYQEFYPGKSKPLMDEIDTLLAQHYGFTAEELDFIVNYDIKYRLGAEDEESDE